MSLLRRKGLDKRLSGRFRAFCERFVGVKGLDGLESGVVAYQNGLNRVVCRLDVPLGGPIGDEGCLFGVGSGRASERQDRDRKSTRLNSSHMSISYAVFCLKK